MVHHTFTPRVGPVQFAPAAAYVCCSRPETQGALGLGAEGWAGYDAILSLAPLLSLHDHGYTFKPIVQDGKVICLTVLLKNHVQLTIKDSMRVIPGALAKLARRFQGRYPEVSLSSLLQSVGVV